MPDTGWRTEHRQRGEPRAVDNRYHLHPSLPPKEALPTMYDLPSETREEPVLAAKVAAGRADEDGAPPLFEWQVVDNRYHLDPSLPPKEALPTMFDLPSEHPEEPGLPDLYHFLQAMLLYETFLTPLCTADWVFKAADHPLYYDPDRPLWYKRPDWFAVLDVPAQADREALRRSYVVWQEGRVPDIVVELLSEGTEPEDLDQKKRAGEASPPTKWEVYERILGVPYYVAFDRADRLPLVFRLEEGRYRPLAVGAEPVWLEGLGLALGPWSGRYQNGAGLWLRWFDQDGHLIPTQEEQVQSERRAAKAMRLRAEAERRRAEAAERRVAELEARLQALGRPDQAGKGGGEEPPDRS